MRAWIALFIVGSICSPARSGPLLAWDRSPDSTVVGYKIYYGVASRNYTNSIDVGNVLTNRVTPLRRGIYYFFAVTSYTAARRESDFSNEVFALAYGDIVLQSATNSAGPWIGLTSAPVRDFAAEFLHVRINRFPNEVRVLNLPDSVPVIIYPFDPVERRRFFRAVYSDP